MTSTRRPSPIVLGALIIFAAAPAPAFAQDTTYQRTCSTSCDWRGENCQRTCTGSISQQPPPEEPFRRGPGTETTIRYDPAAEARKRDILGGADANDGSENLCPSPRYRMTARNGCQPAR